MDELLSKFGEILEIIYYTPALIFLLCCFGWLVFIGIPKFLRFLLRAPFSLYHTIRIGPGHNFFIRWMFWPAFITAVYFPLSFMEDLGNNLPIYAWMIVNALFFISLLAHEDFQKYCMTDEAAHKRDKTGADHSHEQFYPDPKEKPSHPPVQDDFLDSLKTGNREDSENI